MAQLKITLPDPLRAKLDAAVEKSSYSLAEEIRSRLERTFAEDAANPVTRELQQIITDIAELVRQDFGDWHSSRRAHAVFAAMLARLLADYAPPKETTGTPGVSALLEAEDTPEAIAAIAEIRTGDIRRGHEYPRLEAALSRKQRKRLTSARRRRVTREGDDHE